MLLVNGEHGGCIDAADRGFTYGDGLFETVAVVDGRPQLWQRHMERLRSGCRRLGLTPPDAQLLRDELAQVAPPGRCVVKLVITRGAGGRGYLPPQESTPTRVVAAFPWPEYPAEWRQSGVAVRYCRTPLGHTPALAGLKHLNRLEQVLARAEWSGREFAEGLMCDPEGRVVEGTMTNLFLWMDGTLLTPSLMRCGVSGVMRATVIALARNRGIRVVEGDLGRGMLADAEAIFLTNSIIGIWPVRTLDGRACRTAAVVAELQALVDAELADA